VGRIRARAAAEAAAVTESEGGLEGGRCDNREAHSGGRYNKRRVQHAAGTCACNTGILKQIARALRIVLQHFTLNNIKLWGGRYKNDGSSGGRYSNRAGHKCGGSAAAVTEIVVR